MKPLKLILQAFGPFATTQTIDFSLLGDNPLFLINGATGAGKSSILDAICFALYGSTTSKEREAPAMRCDFAENDLLTQVELHFSLGQESYCIKRIPTQLTVKKRGEGTTERKTEASLDKITEDGERVHLVSKKASEATAFIENITGLNVEQFRQVMVLPQGKFREFLMADSNDREKIFSKLFQTQIYKRIEDALKTQASDIHKQYHALQIKKQAFISAAGLTSDEGEAHIEEQLPPLLDHSQVSVSQALAAKETANKIKEQAKTAWDKGQHLQLQFAQLQDSLQLQQQCDVQRPQVEQQQLKHQQALLAEKIQPLFIQLQEADKQLALKSQALQKLAVQLSEQENRCRLSQQQLEQAKSALPQAQQLHSEAQQLMQLIDKIQLLENASSKKNQLAELFSQAQAQETQSQASLNQLQNRIACAVTQSETLKPEALQLPVAQQQLQDIRIQGEESGKLDQLKLALSEKNAQHQHLNVRVNSAQKQANQSAEQLDQLSLQWHQNQAAILAAKLHPDSPCPVCGSENHPQPAHTSSDELITQNHLEAAKQAFDQQQSHLNTLLQEQAAILAQEQALQHQVSEQQQRINADSPLNTEQLRQQYAHSKDEVKRLTVLDNERQTLEQQLLDLRQQEQQAQELWRANHAEVNEQQQALAIGTEQEQQLLATLPESYRNRAALDAAISEKNTRKQALEQDLQQAETDFNQQQSSLIQLQTSVKEQRSQEQDLQQSKNAQALLWREQLNSSSFSDEEAFQAARLSNQALDELSNEINDFKEKQLAVVSAIETLQKTLSNEESPDVEKLNNGFIQARDDFDEKLQRWQQADQRLQQLQQLEKQLNSLATDNAELDSQYQIYGTLADAASGNNTQRLSLQRFVLSVLLDDVLILASQRLQLMSKGRYQLIRKEERAKGNKASGLELEVEDAYSGKTRSVATLSGGESFMAALSLALGLSDVVQAYAGGIKLDTLFIDEGFGSLDQESLDLAIKTLIDLQSSGRTIGIISHVSELKEQMALRIDVKTTASGSSITLSQ